jgi:hypothetical protein
MDLLIILLFFLALIREALDNNNRKKKQSRPRSMASTGKDKDYMDALFVLMAGEDGFFVPSAERRFDRLDDSGDQNDYLGNYDGYNDRVDSGQDDREYSDHWGPV